jgi:hypothetical protein
LPAYPENWICVDTSNPWAKAYDLSAPTCSLSSCAVSCATGRACDNRKYESTGTCSATASRICRIAGDCPAGETCRLRYSTDTDSDGIYNSCDLNDDSNIDGCIDGAADCVAVNFSVEGRDDDAFDVYIDNHLVGRAGRVLQCSINPITHDFSCDYVPKILRINTLSRGLHNFRIVYVGGTPRGDYHVDYETTVADFGLDSSPIIPSPSPTVEHIGEERSIYFTVR